MPTNTKSDRPSFVWALVALLAVAGLAAIAGLVIVVIILVSGTAGR